MESLIENLQTHFDENACYNSIDVVLECYQMVSSTE